MRYNTKECYLVQRKQQIVFGSGLFGKDLMETFANAKIDTHNKDLYAYLQNSWDAKGWLYIHSAANGTGKSYTANAIANMLIDKGVQPFVIREVDMAAKLQKTFEPDAFCSEAYLLQLWKNKPVLIVQDFGKYKAASEWWPQKVFDILDYRIIKGLPTVFTSNLPLDKGVYIKRFGENHGGAIHSRIKGTCILVAELGGADRRLAHG